jgi:polyhydroxybutyrate depolymerase
MIRRALFLVLLAACAGAPTAARYQGGDFRETIAIGSWDRSYRVHVPIRETSGPLAPLILAYHGLGQTAEQLEMNTGLDAAADQAGFIVVYPEAALGQWDVTGDFVTIFGIDDLAFARTLIDRMSNGYVIDDHRIFATGLSNGAVFAQRLACEMADRITGFVAVAGSLSRPARDGCHPDGTVAGLYILGSNDTQFPVGGDDVVLPVDSAMAFWQAENHCAGRGPRIALADTAHDGTRVYRSRYVDCVSGGEIELDSIAGSGHGWPGALVPSAGISRNLSANSEIVRFVMSGRSRPR